MAALNDGQVLVQYLIDEPPHEASPYDICEAFGWSRKWLRYVSRTLQHHSVPALMGVHFWFDHSNNTYRVSAHNLGTSYADDRKGERSAISGVLTHARRGEKNLTAMNIAWTRHRKEIERLTHYNQNLIFEAKQLLTALA